MVDLNAVQNLVASWWFEYDQGNVDVWRGYFTSDAHFACRSDSGQTEFEDFIRADITGGDEVVRWHVEHRNGSPYPLRHFGTNIHITETRPGEVDFRSYLLCTHVVDLGVSNLSTGRVVGTAREAGGKVCFADLRVILDFTNSVPFAEATRYELV